MLEPLKKFHSTFWLQTIQTRHADSDYSNFITWTDDFCSITQFLQPGILFLFHAVTSGWGQSVCRGVQMIIINDNSYRKKCAKEKRGKQIHEKTCRDIVAWGIWWQCCEWLLLALSKLFRHCHNQLLCHCQSQSSLCHVFLAFEVERWDNPWTARLNPQTAISWVEWRHLPDINPDPKSVKFKEMFQHRNVDSNNVETDHKIFNICPLQKFPNLILRKQFLGCAVLQRHFLEMGSS